MKAAIRSRYGGPEVVRVVDADKPGAGAGELLVKVHATTVNRTDCGLRGAKPFVVRLVAGFSRPRLTILGNEFAGEVEAVGDGVSSFKAGDRVFGYDDATLGAHAEYVVVREAGAVALIPEGLTYEEAAPSTEGSHYALSLVEGTRARAGQRVLVYGATGAIGTAALQLLRDLGVTVTAVCGTENVDLAKSLGATDVIDYRTEDFTKDGRRYDAVIDAVGKTSFGRCRRLLRPRGVYVSSDLGPLAQNPFLALVTPLFRGRRVRFPFARNDAAMARHFKELIESGAFRPVIDRTYTLDEIVEAYRYVETGQKTGNVVISIEHSP
ncbi:NAD(P)-dependent alcohol dehydrogenase [Sphaerisporangium aureirubrum]|uniref:NAD(P)-dependent alcohol dehydrogenase n=1 Tax=Sphaerisporangium aureirubrum TaxID=1544736 RepID=A0ABW1NW90_9ACTN